MARVDSLTRKTSPFMKDSGLTTTCTASANLRGPTEASIRASSTRTRSRASAVLRNQMDSFTRATGSMAKRMDTANLRNRMESNMKANSSIIGVMDRARRSGPTAASTLVSGNTGCRMESVSSFSRLARLK